MYLVKLYWESYLNNNIIKFPWKVMALIYVHCVFLWQYDFNVGQGDKISALQSHVNDVKQIMLENVQKVLERGECLDDLLSKTEDLEAGVSPPFH